MNQGVEVPRDISGDADFYDRLVKQIEKMKRLFELQKTSIHTIQSTIVGPDGNPFPIMLTM